MEAKKELEGPFPVVWNEEDQCVQIGKWASSVIVLPKKLDSWAHNVLYENAPDVVRQIVDPWKRGPLYQAFAETFKCNPRQMYNHVRGLLYKKKVAPYAKFLAKVDYKKGYIAYETLHLIKKNLPVVEQTYNDKLYHLLPIVTFTGMSPSELKRELKGVWKEIANNSLNRNRALYKALKFSRQYEPETKIVLLKNYYKFPTTVIERFGAGCTTQCLEHITAHYKGQWSTIKKGDVTLIKYMLMDTQSLADQLGQPFNHMWTPRRLKEEHDRMTQELNARKYSPEKIKWLEEIPIKKFLQNGYEATLLESRLEIAQEGQAMGHCVAGYAECVADGKYFVYSVTKDGERSSTLGISRGSVHTYGMVDRTYCNHNQHYARFNKPITDEEYTLGRDIVREINNHFKEKEKCMMI